MIKEFLKKTDVFSGLTDEELDIVSSLVREENFKDGEFVFTASDPGRKLYLVKEGRLSLSIGSNKIREFERYDIFGEVALISENLRSGNVKALEGSTLYSLNHTEISANNKLPAPLALKILWKLAKRVVSYLRPAAHTKTEELINEGEHDHIEFKTTLRYNLHSKKFGKEIENAALKTVAAFMNSNGGTLIIGVDDDKNIIGLEMDNFENDDKTLLHFISLVKERIGMNHTAFLNAALEAHEGKKILRIDVSPAIIPAYVTYNQQEHFYIRTGPSTTDLRASEIYDYVYNRFYKPKV